jgi:hypothetical protein
MTMSIGITTLMWDARHSVRVQAEDLAFTVVALKARWIEGLLFYGFTIGDGSLDAHALFNVQAGVGLTADQTMPSLVLDPAAGQIPIYYKQQQGPTGWLYWPPQTSPVWTGQDPGAQYWNDLSGVNPDLFALADGEVMFVHYYLTRQIDPTTGLPELVVIGICGQAVFPNIAAAQAVENTAHAALDFSGLPFQEFVALASVIVQHDSGFGNTFKLRVIPTSDGEDYVDLRNILGGGGGGGGGAAFPGYGGAPPEVDYGAADAGVAPTASRSDHTHDLALHAVEHEPSGADPLATATAIGIGGGNAEGTAESFARSDHDHAIHETGGPTDLAVGAIADGEFVKRVGPALVGATPPTGFPGYGGAPAQIDVGDAGSGGVAATVSRSDHEHAFPVPGLPAAQVVGAGAAGASAKVAREDHVHPMSALAPAAHAATHLPGGSDALTTAAPTAVGVATASAEGVAANFARSDHKHQSNTLPSAQVAGAGSTGTSGEPARADHVHPMASLGSIDAVDVIYGPTNPGDWYAPDPVNAEEALDRLAKLRVLTGTAFSATPTFDFTDEKNWHQITLTGNITAITFTAPRQIGTIVIKFIQDGTGGWTVVGWPASTRWAGGVKPTFGDVPGAIRIVTAWYDGSVYHCEFRPEAYIA